MKTWTSQTPLDSDFNRIESLTKKIVELPKEFNGLKTLPSIALIKTPNIDIDSTDFKACTIQTDGTSFSTSVAIENPKRVTIPIVDGEIKWIYPPDSVVKTQLTSLALGQYIEGYSNYYGTNLVIFQGNSFSDSEVGTYTAINLNTGFTQNIYITAHSTPPTYRYQWVNMGVGLIRITKMSPPSKAWGGEYIAIRRCKYPLIANDPIRVYNPTYTATESRLIVKDDILKNKIC